MKSASSQKKLANRGHHASNGNLKMTVNRESGVVPPEFTNPTAIEPSPYIEVHHEGGNHALQTFCFLLFLVLFGRISFKSFLLDFIELFAKPNISKSERFSALI